LGPRGWQKILHMDHRKALRVTREIVARIPAAQDHPTAVDLELHQLRIGLLQEHVVAHGAIALRRELEIVVVVRVLEARALCLLTETIGERCRSMGLVQTHAWRWPVLEQRRTQAPAGRILRTERMRLLEECTMLAGIEWQMGTWAPQARIIEQRPELLRRQ